MRYKSEPVQKHWLHNMHLACTNARTSCLPKNNGKDKVFRKAFSRCDCSIDIVVNWSFHGTREQKEGETVNWMKGRHLNEGQACLNRTQQTHIRQGLQLQTFSPWTEVSPCTPRLLKATLTVSGHWTSDLGIVERGPGSSITLRCYCRSNRPK